MKLEGKLKFIRLSLNLTQDKMAEELGMTTESRRSRISEWETGKSEPNRNILLLYADLGNVNIRNLIDDKIRLKKSEDT
jgi:transcriptional regulator with XRE-family HTH domain